MRDLIESMMESLEDDPKNPQDSKEKWLKKKPVFLELQPSYITGPRVQPSGAMNPFLELPSYDKVQFPLIIKKVIITTEYM